MSTLSPAGRRRALGTLAVLVSVVTTGCFGGFNLTRKLYGFNASVSNKFARWLVFVVLVIIPIYGLFLFIDVVLLNLIEFWAGTNPVSARHDLGNGHKLALDVLPDQPDVVRVVLTHLGREVRVLHARRHTDGITLLDRSLAPLARVRETAGGVTLEGPEGEALAQVDEATIERLETEVAEGRSLAQAALAELDASGASRQLASLRRSDHARF